MRCVSEASTHAESCFITLTYSDEHLPEYGSLRKKDFQDFMKRLRRRFEPRRVRFFHCGEYGDETRRPHYHALLFGVDFPDRVHYAKSSSGEALDMSPMLDALWAQGISTVGNVTFESAAYVARYVCKKVTGEKAREHYSVVDRDSGEVHFLVPEYATMSRRPGIGARWFDRYASDVFPSDEFVLNGNARKPPKYFADLLERASPEIHQQVMEARRSRGVKKSEQTWQRLQVREKVKKAQAQQLKRKL